MKLGSKIMTAGDSGGIVNEGESDVVYDLRLARRWKRKRIASRNLRLSCCDDKAPKKTISKNNEALVEAVAVNSDYLKFRYDMVQFVDADNSGGMVNEEESDMADGLRLARRRKRRRIEFENGRLNSCSKKASKKTIRKNNNNYEALVQTITVDSDYEKLLDDLVQFVDVDNDVWCVANVNDDDDVSEVLDAHYVMFLDNLKEDGKSYVLELALNNETSVIVKYEEENGLSNELGMENLVTMKDSHNIENIGTENILSSRLEREKIKGPIRIFRSNFGRERTESQRKVLRSNSVRQKTKSSKIDLRSSSRWRKTKSTRKTLRSSSRREDNNSLSSLNDAVKRVKIGSLRTLRNGSRRESIATQKKLRDVHTTDKKSPVVDKDVQMETRSPISCVANGCSSKRHNLEATHLAKQRLNHGMKSDFVDETYQIFLNSVEKDDQCSVDGPEGGEKMMHFKDEGSNSEVVVLDDPFLTGNYTPFISSRAYGPCVDVVGEGCTESKESQFREKLLEKLHRPYDITEYARLQLDSKPYLRVHNDLATKIRKARRDRRKILNLLRGFFYWLQYLNSEGAFLPWLDSECLSILPPD